jgi:hypothetical protein
MPNGFQLKNIYTVLKCHRMKIAARLRAGFQGQQKDYMKWIQNLVIVLSSSILLCAARGAETVLFEETFDTDTSGNWTVIGDSPTDTPDHTAQFAFDYGAQKYTFNGVTNTIPPAPRSSGSSRGLKLTVNKDTTAETAGVSLYPTGKRFSGNYALRAEVWMNYNGPAFGGEGSTEFSTFGVNHTGTQANWHSTETVGDGLWFAMSGEGGAGQDYRAYEWDGFSVVFLRGANGGLIGEDHGEAVFRERFPNPFFESRGAPGKRWVGIEVQQRDNNIIWKVDGYVIAERPNATAATEGNIMIGMMDVFSSLANPPQDNYVIFDNVRVVQLDAAVPPTVSIAVTDDTAAEPGADTALMTVTRTGADTASLTVAYRVYGTAQSGSDFATPPGSVTIPAGQSSATITITPLDDAKGETNETITVALVGLEGSNYELRSDISATVNLLDDGDVSTVNMTVTDPFAYELETGDFGRVNITRTGDLTVPLQVNLSFGGTAQGGLDYKSMGPSFTIPGGENLISINIEPINGTQINGSRTVVLTLVPGAGYVLGTNTNAVITIRNDDLEPGATAFFDNFDTDTSANWMVNEANAGSNRAEFNWDYSTLGIPPAPHTTNSTTRGLLLQANTGETGVFTGLSASPTGFGIEGDYRLRFDAWINFPGPLDVGAAGSTMMLSAGVGTAGDASQFPGTSVQGVLFAVSADGQTTIDYRAYAATGAPLLPETGAYAAGTHASARANTDSYYAAFGGRSAPALQVANFSSQTGVTAAGAPGFAWRDMVITKKGTNITWMIDGIPLATITLTNKEISTNIFVGHFDINAGQPAPENFPLAFALIDNLRVEALTNLPIVTSVRINSISKSVSRNDILIDFATTPDVPRSMVVESSERVDGTYSAEPNVEFNAISAGGITTWRARFPMTTPNRFFRIRAQ